jgi:penicillin-binding protein 2
MPELVGVHTDTAEIRHYPLGILAAHVVGYVGAPEKKDVRENPVYAKADFRVGKFGLEQSLEDKLQGTGGIKRIEVNAHGRSVRELSLDESVPGQDITLAIDSRLQEFAANRIKNEGGVKDSGASVVMMDIHTGDVRVMASTPAYDPNELVRGVSYDEWRMLTSHPDSPLINKAITTQYPPGSTFKPIVALAALKHGDANASTSVFCPGYLEFGGRRFHCWNEDGHGHVNMRDALAKSCNVYFYKVGHSVGVDNIAEMANRFGLGHTLGIELHGEKPGIIPSKEWKQKTYGRGWHPGETLNTAIGQGYVLSTPLQLATFAARLASGKKMVTPRLLPATPEEMAAFDDLGVPESHLRIVREGMNRVVNSSYGTARGSRILDKRYYFAGKTGTAQVRALQKDDPKPKERRFRNHALFIGFAPVQNPRYAMSVVVEHGIGGSRTAAPIAKDIFFEAQRLDDEDAKLREKENATHKDG